MGPDIQVFRADHAVAGGDRTRRDHRYMARLLRYSVYSLKIYEQIPVTGPCESMGEIQVTERLDFIDGTPALFI